MFVVNVSETPSAKLTSTDTLPSVCLNVPPPQYSPHSGSSLDCCQFFPSPEPCPAHLSIMIPPLLVLPSQRARTRTHSPSQVTSLPCTWCSLRSPPPALLLRICPPPARHPHPPLPALCPGEPVLPRLPLAPTHHGQRLPLLGGCFPSMPEGRPHAWPGPRGHLAAHQAHGTSHPTRWPRAIRGGGWRGQQRSDPGPPCPAGRSQASRAAAAHRRGGSGQPSKPGTSGRVF